MQGQEREEVHWESGRRERDGPRKPPGWLSLRTMARRDKILVFFLFAPYRTLDSARLGDGSLRSKFFVAKSF